MKLVDAPILKFRHLIIKKSERAKYEAAQVKNLSETIENEKGALLMLAGFDKDDPQSSYILECYQDPLDYQEYEASAQFKHYSEVTNDVISENERFDLTPQVILMQDYPLNSVQNDELFIQMMKYTVVDEDLEKLEKEVKREADEMLINEEDYLGTVAGNFFDIENEWRIFTIFKNKEAYDRHVKSNWHHAFNENTREMIYSEENIHLKAFCFGDKGELIYSK